jgi:Cys-tRNA(Pro)/Cys-tRNA(Cys) deacylase
VARRARTTASAATPGARAAAAARREGGADGRPRDAERLAGYVTGGISPLGQRRRLRTWVDASAAAHETVFVSGGRRGLELELRPDDLVRLTGGAFAPLTAG